MALLDAQKIFSNNPTPTKSQTSSSPSNMVATNPRFSSPTIHTRRFSLRDSQGERVGSIENVLIINSKNDKIAKHIPGENQILDLSDADNSMLGGDPENVIEALKRAFFKGVDITCMLNKLENHIRANRDGWVMELLDVNVIQTLLELIVSLIDEYKHLEERLRKNEPTLSKTIVQECRFNVMQQNACASCVRAIIETRVGLKYLATSQCGSDQGHEFGDLEISSNIDNCSLLFAKAFATSLRTVKHKLYEILTALCLYNQDGHKFASQTMEQYKKIQGKQSKFDGILQDLNNLLIHATSPMSNVNAMGVQESLARREKRSNYEHTLICFLNALLMGASDGALATNRKIYLERRSMRHELLGLDILTLISKLKPGASDAIRYQYETFEEMCQMERFVYGFDINKPGDIFQALLHKVKDSPQYASFLMVLQLLWQMDTDHHSGPQISLNAWEIVTNVLTKLSLALNSSHYCHTQGRALSNNSLIGSVVDKLSDFPCHKGVQTRPRSLLKKTVCRRTTLHKPRYIESHSSFVSSFKQHHRGKVVPNLKIGRGSKKLHRTPNNFLPNDARKKDLTQLGNKEVIRNANKERIIICPKCQYHIMMSNREVDNEQVVSSITLESLPTSPPSHAYKSFDSEIKDRVRQRRRSMRRSLQVDQFGDVQHPPANNESDSNANDDDRCDETFYQSYHQWDGPSQHNLTREETLRECRNPPVIENDIFPNDKLFCRRGSKARLRGSLNTTANEDCVRHKTIVDKANNLTKSSTPFRYVKEANKGIERSSTPIPIAPPLPPPTPGQTRKLITTVPLPVSEIHICNKLDRNSSFLHKDNPHRTPNLFTHLRSNIAQNSPFNNSLSSTPNQPAAHFKIRPTSQAQNTDESKCLADCNFTSQLKHPTFPNPLSVQSSKTLDTSGIKEGDLHNMANEHNTSHNKSFSQTKSLARITEMLCPPVFGAEIRGDSNLPDSPINVGDDGKATNLPQVLCVPRPKHRMKTLNWTKLPANVVKNKESIWNRVLTMPNYVKINYDELEDLFSISSRETPVKKKNSRSKESTEILFLEHKRSMNLNILLKQFKCPTARVIQMISEMKHEEIGSDRLKGILNNLPDKNEVSMIKNFDGDRERLGTAEQFYAQLILIPDYQILVEALLMKEEFFPSVEMLKRQMESVSAVCHELMNNQNLEKFLLLVLKIGNFFNANNYAGNALGFKVSFLTKLMDTRAKIPRVTLLHYLLDMAYNIDPAILDFPSELSALRAVQKISMESLNYEVNELNKSIEKLDRDMKKAKEIRDKFIGFLQTAKKMVKDLKMESQAMQVIVNKLAKRYCEDEQKLNLQEFFATFTNFCDKVENAKKDNTQRKLNAENESKRRTKQPNYLTPCQKSQTSLTNNTSGLGDENENMIEKLLDEIRRGEFKLHKRHSDNNGYIGNNALNNNSSHSFLHSPHQQNGRSSVTSTCSSYNDSSSMLSSIGDLRLHHEKNTTNPNQEALKNGILKSNNLKKEDTGIDSINLYEREI